MSNASKASVNEIDLHNICPDPQEAYIDSNFLTRLAHSHISLENRR